MRKKTFYTCLIVMAIIFLSPFTLGAGFKKSPMGIYAGWSFALDNGFNWSYHPYRSYKESIDYQVGIYKEFYLSERFSLQADLNCQHFYYKFEARPPLSPSKITDNEPVVSLTANTLIYLRRGPSFPIYFQVGVGFGIGKVSMNLLDKTHWHYSGGIGLKLPMGWKTRLNIFAKVVRAFSPDEYNTYSVFYPAIAAGIEF